MAKRYRYSFAKKKEARKGKWSVAIAAFSLALFIAAFFASVLLEQQYQFVVGGLSLFAASLSVYGFLLGVLGFSEKDRMHRTSIIGSITNGVFMLAWLGFYLVGL